MKKNLNRLIAIALILMMCIQLIPVTQADAVSVASVGSLLDSFTSNSSTYTLKPTSRIYVASGSEPTGDLLQTVQLIQRQLAAAGYPNSATLPIVWGPATWAKDGDLVLCLDVNSGIGAEAYQLNVSTVATVNASDVDGLLYGTYMLMKCFRYGGSMTLQGFTAEDAPDTKERTVQLDCGRKYYTKEWICNFIRQLSWMGYNTIELHFSDDSGFRMDFWDPAYYTDDYAPKNDFTWLCGSHYTSWTLPDYQKDVDAGKYLKTSEIIEILQTAKEYHIDVIPAFDTPAHLDYTTWKYEQNYWSNQNYSFYSTKDGTTYYAKDVLGCINYCGTTGYSAPQYPYYSAVNLNNEQAYAFIFELYTDIANFFKVYAGSTDFSIGADEVNLNYSPKWEYSDFVDYINELNGMLNDKGYTVRMFNDFIGSTVYNQSSDFDKNIEIQYWTSPFNPTYYSSESTQAASVFANEGRTLYNCIQTHTYYALRVTSDGSDARDPANRAWTFYHSTEQCIYDEWVPNNFREIGDRVEDNRIIASDRIGGAYFLIWCDYNCVSTEKEIWEGAHDANNSNVYYLLDRMWSNTIKMWNWDVNNTVTYSNYAAIRETFGYFPGYTSCTEPASLPAATDPSYSFLADHSKLEAALANKISNDSGTYTTNSYSVYEAAYNAAVAVNADHGATEVQITEAIENLAAAKANLVLADVDLIVEFKTIVDGQTVVLKTVCYRVAGSYSIYIAPINGYTYQSSESTKFVPLKSGDGSGYLMGYITQSKTVTLWYENTPNTNRLNDLVSTAITEQGSYTDASWAAYQAALEAARSFSVGNATTQTDVDAKVAALEKALSELVVTTDSTEIISVEPLSDTVKQGKQVGLKVTTTADVATLSIESETLTLCTGKVQTLSTGETVKIWLVYFRADEAGTFTYTVNAGNVTANVEITVN